MFLPKNKKLYSKILVSLFFSISIIGCFAFINILSASATDLTLEVPIGQQNPVFKFDGTTAPLAQYIKQIYNYAIGAVGILAAVMLMVGGLMWIMAGGNTGTIGEAKTIIFASLSGLVLVMGSYLLLLQVNPALVNLSNNVTGIAKIQKEEAKTPDDGGTGCKWMKTMECISSAGYAETNDATKCTNEKSEKCCCNYTPVTNSTYSGCAWKSGTVCAADKKASGATTEEEVKICGSVGADYDGTCCCDKCPNCTTLEGAIGCDTTACPTNTAFGDILVNAYSVRNTIDWQIIEPEASRTTSGDCYETGTCKSIWMNSWTQANAKKLYNDLKTAGTGTTVLICNENNNCCTSIYPEVPECMDRSRNSGSTAVITYFYVENK